jgi:hypothetical protein
MNRTTHTFTRLAVLATTALALLLVSVGRAAAQRVELPGGTVGTGSEHAGPTPVPTQPIVDASVSALQWTLFAVVVLSALVLGAVLTNLAQSHRGAPPVAEGQAAARSSA